MPTDAGSAAGTALFTPRLSVIIPAYNEEERLGKSLPEIIRYLSSRDYTWEIIVVDDGSADGTSRITEKLCAGHPHTVLRNEPNRGKGYSIRRGMTEAMGEYRLFTDADLSTPIDELEKFWRHADEGAGVVIGSRALPGSDLVVRQRKYRELMGRIFNTLVQKMAVSGIHDTQCGFKLFSAEAAEAIFPLQTLDGFAFDVELLMLARKKGFRIVEVAVRWINSPASKVSAWRDSTRMFLDLLRIRLRN